MLLMPEQVFSQPPQKAYLAPAWACVTVGIHRVGEVRDIVDSLADMMAGARYDPSDVHAVRLALEEALVNAIKHGNRGDPAKAVRVRYAVTPEEVRAEVEDQGTGFDPGAVPDPLALENLEKPSGRGLLLMRHYMTEVHYNARGNVVSLRKSRTSL